MFRIIACAVIVEWDPDRPANSQEELLDLTPAGGGVWTEKGSKMGWDIVLVDTAKENMGSHDISHGIGDGDPDKNSLALVAAPGENIPLIEDTRGSKVTREPDLSNILNSGVDVFGGAIKIIDVVEERRRLDGVDSGTRSNEIVCGGDWDDHSMR